MYQHTSRSTSRGASHKRETSRGSLLSSHRASAALTGRDSRRLSEGSSPVPEPTRTLMCGLAHFIMRVKKSNPINTPLERTCQTKFAYVCSQMRGFSGQQLARWSARPGVTLPTLAPPANPSLTHLPPRTANTDPRAAAMMRANVDTPHFRTPRCHRRPERNLSHRGREAARLRHPGVQNSPTAATPTGFPLKRRVTHKCGS